MPAAKKAYPASPLGSKKAKAKEVAKKMRPPAPDQSLDDFAKSFSSTPKLRVDLPLQPKKDAGR